MLNVHLVSAFSSAESFSWLIAAVFNAHEGIEILLTFRSMLYTISSVGSMRAIPQLVMFFAAFILQKTFFSASYVRSNASVLTLCIVLSNQRFKV